MRTHPRNALMILAVLLWTAVPASRATDSEPDSTLLYIYGPDCGACIQFMAEAGGIYPKTRESKLMPMSQVTFDAWQAGDHPLAGCEISPVFATPTYIQVMGCKEVDRITGYSNDELWWFSLKRMVDRLETASSS